MKKVIAVLLTCVILVGAISAYSVLVSAEGDASCSLTLCYGRGGAPLGGISVKVYRIAEAVDDGGYRLCGKFADYPVNVYGITSQSEWKKITSTLASYIAADKIPPDHTGVTDAEGNVRFDALSSGLYLACSVRYEDTDAVCLFEDCLTALPGRDAEGGHAYDVTAKPKYDLLPPSPAEVEFKIVKQWKDDGAGDKRPSYVEVDIIKDGNTVDSVRLGADNDWCCKWTAPDDKSVWHAVERNVPDGYKVTVVSEGRTIVITNSYESAQEPPDTGDTTLLWHYLMLMCVSGALLITLGWIRMRTEK